MIASDDIRGLLNRRVLIVVPIRIARSLLPNKKRCRMEAGYGGAVSEGDPAWIVRRFILRGF
jgi:hypothetical protein